MSITSHQLDSLSDTTTVYNGSDKIGRIGQIYLDDQTGEPSWVTVKTGLFGAQETFVPLQNAEVTDGDVQVRFDQDTIKGAPRIDADGKLSPEEEDELYRYYGLSSSNQSGQVTDEVVSNRTGGDATVGDTTVGNTRNTGDATVGDATVGDTHNTGGTVGTDTSGPTTDNAMTRSEEQLRVGTETREAGRVRLRKYVTTEQVTKTVPVQHEEVTLEREPITDANRGAAHDGPAISEEEHEVTLREEVPVVEKEAVPVERVKLGTETVTEENTVTEDVRKENVEVVDPDTRDRH